MSMYFLIWNCAVSHLHN